MKSQYCIVVFLSVLLLAGCSKQPIVSGTTQANSQDYYSSRIEEAKVTAEKCVAFESSGYSTMSPSEQKSWNDTTDGVNCRNARIAMLGWMQAERARKFRETNERLR